MAGRDDWTDIAAGDADELRERILTGYKAGKPFTPYVPTIPLPAPIDSVLDFGCGLGRNFPYLKTIAAQGGRVRPAADDRPVPCAGDRKGETTSALIGRTCVSGRYDARVRVARAAAHRHRGVPRLPGRLRAHGAARVSSDPDPHRFRCRHARSGRRIRPLPPGPCRIVDHDPVTHQLRIIGDRTFDQARESTDDVHYEMLLRSQIP